MKKFWTVWVTAFVLLFILVGCTKESAAGEEEPKETDVITVWTYPHYTENKEAGQESYETHLKELIAEFEEEYPHIKIEYEILSWEEGPIKFEDALNAGNPPDVYFSSMEPKYVRSGLAVPLDDYLTSEDISDLVVFARDTFSLDGSIWAIPHWVSVETWGGNRELLEEAGADIDKIQEEGWTWDEFYEIAKKISQMRTSGSKKVFGFVTHGEDESTLAHLMKNNGVLKQVSEEGEFLWTGEKAIDTLHFIKKLMNDSIMPKNTAEMSADEVLEMFYAGEVGIFGPTGSQQVRVNDFRNKEIEAGLIEGKPIDFVLLPFPYNEREREFSSGSTAGLWLFKQNMYKGDEHTENAAKVLKHLTGKESSIAAATMHIMPARKSGQEEYANVLQLETDNGRFMERILNYIVPETKLEPDLADKASQIVNEGIRPSFQSFLAGELSAEEAVEQWTTVAEEILNK